ncbi:MAG TPA: hypothetical protein PKN34_09600 [Azospira sp.]|nr:hypothetical protein [Azospira sp.]
MNDIAIECPDFLLHKSKGVHRPDISRQLVEKATGHCRFAAQK